MKDRGRERLVYSTGVGRVCQVCGWPVGQCTCSRRAPSESRRAKSGAIVAKLRIEKKGRGGKVVTVVAGLPRDEVFLKELSQELKRACGTGGAVSDDSIELQGDLRDRIRECLLKKAFVVKG